MTGPEYEAIKKLAARVDNGAEIVHIIEADRRAAEARRQALKEAEGIARAELSDWRGSTGGIERIIAALAALAASPKTGE